MVEATAQCSAECADPLLFLGTDLLPQLIPFFPTVPRLLPLLFLLRFSLYFSTISLQIPFSEPVDLPEPVQGCCSLIFFRREESHQEQTHEVSSALKGRMVGKERVEWSDAKHRGTKPYAQWTHKMKKYFLLVAAGCFWHYFFIKSALSFLVFNGLNFSNFMFHGCLSEIKQSTHWHLILLHFFSKHFVI